MFTLSDQQKLKNQISKQINLLKRKYSNSPVLIQDLDATKAELDNCVEEENKIIITDSLTRQRFNYFLGGYLALHDERKAWYFYHAVTLVLSIDEVEHIVKKRFGENYYDFKNRLAAYSSLLNKIKYHLDHMDDKTLKEGDLNSQTYKATMELLSKLPLIWQELDAVFIIICRYTNIGQTTVPQQAITTFQQQYKKVTYQDDKKTNITTDTRE